MKQYLFHASALISAIVVCVFLGLWSLPSSRFLNPLKNLSGISSKTNCWSSSRPESFWLTQSVQWWWMTSRLPCPCPAWLNSTFLQSCHSALAFATLVSSYYDDCSFRNDSFHSNNYVKPRGDTIGKDDYSPNRLFSLHAGSYPTPRLSQPARDDSPMDATMEWPVTSSEDRWQDLPICDSVSSLLQSLRDGQRHPFEVNQTSIENINPFTDRSSFVPFGCKFRWYKAEEICDVLASYSSIFLLGDSLTRHLAQGLMVLLTSNLKHGAFPPLSAPIIYRDCKCDGQYSEHGDCRSYSHDMISNMDLPQRFGLCQAHEQQFRLRFHTGEFSHLNSICDDLVINQTDVRPIALFLSYATHDSVDARVVIENHFEKQRSALNSIFQSCRERFRNETGYRRPPRISEEWMDKDVPVLISFGTMSKQSSELDNKYGRQDVSHVLAFNQAMREYFSWSESASSLSLRRTRVFDWFNLSYNAPTSDGLHFLLDVNLIKAQYFINYLDLSLNRSSEPI